MQSPVPGLRAAAAQTQDAGLNWAEVKGAGVPAELVDSAIWSGSDESRVWLGHFLVAPWIPSLAWEFPHAQNGGETHSNSSGCTQEAGGALLAPRLQLLAEFR